MTSILLVLLLSACFVGCQFHSMLDVDSSQNSEESKSQINGDALLGPGTNETDSESESIVQPPDTHTYYSLLTGLPTTKQLSQARPIAVCVGNTAASLPQYGLSSADILIEAPVEGGSTRLMAVTENYASVNCYGSVRSTRDYLQILARGFDAMSIYAGTSDIDEKTGYDVGDSLDYIAQNLTTTFYRDAQRKSPHNLMTSGGLLSLAIDDCGYRTVTTGDTLPYQIATDASKTATACHLPAVRIELPFSSLQNTVFNYDTAKKVYLRSQNGSEHIDAGNLTQLQYRNLILVFCDSVTKPNASGNTTLTMSLNEGGTAYYISGGKATEIKWSRASEASSLTFTDIAGKPLVISAGKTYIGLLKSATLESIVIE